MIKRTILVLEAEDFVNGEIALANVKSSLQPVEEAAVVLYRNELGHMIYLKNSFGHPFEMPEAGRVSGMI